MGRGVAKASVERRHIAGLEWGRALAILAVVGWHSQGLGRAKVLTPFYEGGFGDVAGVVYLNVLLLAVPVFMSISLFLYIRSEWRWLADLLDEQRIPAYTRPSLVLGTALVMAALVTEAWPDWRPAMLLAELSLAVYCIHIFVLDHLGSLLPTLSDAQAREGPLAFLLTLAITLPIAYGLRRRVVL
jgi:peptidoglycan/LPS O-acetylase OafA/YrhL